MEKNSKIYVAGHSGMVGSAIVRELNKQGYTNLILKNHKELDLTRQEAVENFFVKEKPEYVFLAAAKVGGIGANIESPGDFLIENLLIQDNVINASLKNNVTKLMFLGSSCIYPRLCSQPMKEEYLMDGKVEPTNEGYAIAKITGLKLCELLNKQYNVNFISVMPCNLFGYNDDFISEKSHVVPALIRKIHLAKIRNDKNVVIWGTGNARRELLFTEDLADACIYFMNTYNSPDFINIGSGIDYTIKEIVNKIKDIIEYTGDVIYDTTKSDGMPQKLLDVSKANELGWKYKTNIDNALRLTYNWYLKNIWRDNGK